ncbi:MFS transporter [Deinococcus humi]|uniref:DHA3 family macrolide efflux protein-like MFS transporter n=1 Tax=Deinococcus humi TaxID=662880 RepID=A0A7W8JVW1_9DEIO|nr:MFS transporter [Deinococcus humi]MBB5363940.1 DHA3 family macrolide efflux protein-like MFS transporter [Deinococcus humi]GGO40501.1 MFS transporter [Deinococcus humi]
MPTHLWNRSFVIWLLGTAQSQLGSALAGIALSFLVLHQTGSAGQMALTLACALAPNLLMPLAGALVDRVHLKVPLIGADVARGLLQFTVGGLALAWGEVPLWLVNGAAVLTGLAGIFAGPASSAAVPGLVPEQELTRANGLIGGVGQGAWLLGTLLGGALVTAFSPALAIVLDGASFLVMAVLLLLVQLPRRELKTERVESVLGSVASGLRLMRRSRVLLFLPLIALLLNASLAPVQVLLPKLLLGGAGAQGYGQYLAAESAGMLVASALLALIGPRLPLRRTVALGLVVLGSSLFLLIGFAAPPALLGIGVLMGLAMALVNTPVITLMQQLVPPAFLGRTFSVLGMVATLGMPLTLLALSPVVDRFPAALFFMVAGGMTVLMALAWTWVVLSERKLPDLETEPGGFRAG